jgi:chromosome segregation ATPase
MTALTKSEIKILTDLINGQFSQVNQRFDQIDTRLEQADRRFDQIEAQLAKTDRRFDQINTRFDKVDQDIHGLDKRLTVIETRLEEWKPAIATIPDLAKADEKLEYIREIITDLKKQSDKQDNRLWLLVSGLSFTLLGAIAKVIFFPNP